MKQQIEEEEVWQAELKRKRDRILRSGFSSKEEKIEELQQLLIEDGKLDELLEKARLWDEMQKKQKSGFGKMGIHDELYEDESEI